MNREILFRGKRKDNNEWVYGWVHRGLLGNVWYLIEEYDYKSIEVIPETIGQYTGLTDKNGKKIFEGDIIDIHQTVNGCNQFVIEYDNYKFSARYYNQKTKEIRSWYGYDLDKLFEINELEKELEVIGNIYESKINE